MVENGRPRLDLGVEHVRVVDAYENLEVRLHARRLYRVDNRTLSDREDSKRWEGGGGGGFEALQTQVATSTPFSKLRPSRYSTAQECANMKGGVPVRTSTSDLLAQSIFHRKANREV